MLEPGCCVDRRYKEKHPDAYMPRACNDKTCMLLPAGCTCADCVGFARCKALLGRNGSETVCDFFPRRFRFNEVRELRAMLSDARRMAGEQWERALAQRCIANHEILRREQARSDYYAVRDANRGLESEVWVLRKLLKDALVAQFLGAEPAELDETARVKAHIDEITGQREEALAKAGRAENSASNAGYDLDAAQSEIVRINEALKGANQDAADAEQWSRDAEARLLTADLATAKGALGKIQETVDLIRGSGSSAPGLDLIDELATWALAAQPPAQGTSGGRP